MTESFFFFQEIIAIVHLGLYIDANGAIILRDHEHKIV